MNKSKTVEYGKYGYMFIAPFFIVYAIFQLYPLVYTVWLSFVENYYKGLQQIGPNFVGLNNYLSVLIETDNNYQIVEGAKFLDTMTVMSIKNTLIMWIFNFIPQILLALLLSAWFTDTVVKLKGQGAFKVMMFLPNIITASSIAVLFNSLFGNQGPVTLLVRKLPGLGDYSFLNSKAGTIGLIGFMQFWMWYGNTMIVLIAGILGISPSLYEAAMVDGANSRQEFFKITLPLLKPILQFSLVTSAIGGLQMYDIPALFNVNNGVGQPGRISHTVTMMIREVAFSQNPDYGYAGAISVILFICTMIISMIFFIATKDRPDKQKHAVKKA